MTAPPVKDFVGRPSIEATGATADTSTPPPFVRITGDRMTGTLQLQPLTGDAIEVFDLSDVLNFFVTPAGDVHGVEFFGSGLGLTDVVLTAEVGVASGVASLDSGGKVPISQLPASHLAATFVVASQAAMLALSTAVQGDFAIRTDVSETFVLSASPASTLANWILLPSLGGVSSWNTRTGAVVPQANDYAYADLSGKPSTIAGISSGVATDFNTLGDARWIQLAGVNVLHGAPSGTGPLDTTAILLVPTVVGSNVFALAVQRATSSSNDNITGLDALGNIVLTEKSGGGPAGRIAFSDFTNSNVATISVVRGPTNAPHQFGATPATSTSALILGANVIIESNTADVVPGFIVRGPDVATSITTNIQQWESKGHGVGDPTSPSTVVASVRGDGRGSFRGLDVPGGYDVDFGGNLNVLGTITFANPNIVFNIPNNSSFPTPPVIGLFFGTTNPGDVQGHSYIDERGNLNLRASGQFLFGTLINELKPGIRWSEPVANSQMALLPLFQQTIWGSTPGNVLELQSGSLLIDARTTGGGASDVPPLIVLRRTSGQTYDITTWGTQVTTQDGFVARGGSVTAVAGVRPTGNWYNVSAPPVHSTDAGTPGEMAWDATYEYRCRASGDWQRTARGTGAF